jgi:hypothetical protein
LKKSKSKAGEIRRSRKNLKKILYYVIHCLPFQNCRLLLFCPFNSRHFQLCIGLWSNCVSMFFTEWNVFLKPFWKEYYFGITSNIKNVSTDEKIYSNLIYHFQFYISYPFEKSSQPEISDIAFFSIKFFHHLGSLIQNHFFRYSQSPP